MEAALELYNTSNHLLASTSLFGYFCRKSGSGTTVARSGLGNTTPSKAVVTISGAGYSYPFVAIQMPGYTVGAAATFASNYQFATNAPIGTTFKYYIFDYGPSLPGANVGLEMYDLSGNITFGSTFHPMLALEIRTSGAVTYTGKALAAGLGVVGARRQFNGYDYYDGSPGHWVLVPTGDPYTGTGYQNDYQIYGAAISNSNQTLTYGSISYDDVYIGPVSGDAPVGPNFDDKAPVLVVDVTGIPDATTFF